MMKRFLLTFFLISISLHAKSLPEWTATGKYERYSQIQYLTGLGIGTTKKAADDQARAEIAKIFNAQIKAESQDIMNSTRQYAKNNSVNVQSEETIKDITRVSTEKTLNGIEIKETVTEDLPDSSKRYYSLAVLDKIKMQVDLVSEITGIDKAIDELVMSAEGESDPLKKIRSFFSAIRKTLKRNLLNVDLKIVDTIGTGVEPKHRLSDLNSKLSSVLLSDFKVGIILDKEKVNNINSVEEALLDGLTKEGLIIEPDVTKCAVTITGNVELQNIKHPLNKEGWVIMQYSGSFQVIDAKTKNQFGSYSISGKATKLTEDDARKNAIESLKKDIAEKVAANITKSIFSTPEKSQEKIAEPNV